MRKIVVRLSDLYDLIKGLWETKAIKSSISNFLVLSFVFSVLLYILFQFGIIKTENEFFTHPFFAIEVSFTLLLIFELFSLIFVLPKSVASSNSKQYEILSLIFLRSGFKEFSHIHSLSDWTLKSEPLMNMFTYGIGGLVIFIIINFSYRMQKHVKLTPNEDDQTGFIRFKKVLSLMLLVAFFVIGVFDLRDLLMTGIYNQSFEMFYTILIFSDIIIVLFALRYSSEYLRIFRYSAFVLATIFIRISFTLNTRESVIVGISGALFVMLLTYSYNYFLQKEIAK
ncbi:MAG: hypothetical protein OEY34_05730 [Cyclobacteriaceae bacterium]|nr:hypothetical protein [Cyclobacteriaceae bacterium]